MLAGSGRGALTHGGEVRDLARRGIEIEMGDKEGGKSGRALKTHHPSPFPARPPRARPEWTHAARQTTPPCPWPPRPRQGALPPPRRPPSSSRPRHRPARMPSKKTAIASSPVSPSSTTRAGPIVHGDVWDNPAERGADAGKARGTSYCSPFSPSHSPPFLHTRVPTPSPRPPYRTRVPPAPSTPPLISQPASTRTP
jgi:hypothetical protein